MHYGGKTGLKILQVNVERFEANGQDPWMLFCFDYDFILEHFGKDAADWAKDKKEAQLDDFLARMDTIPNIGKAKKDGAALDLAAGSI
jgi:hypothetical protein